METIISYLDTMFAGLPRTPDTERVKGELLAMMEDKYHELKNQGKAENEIIGTVISEFGNIDELMDELGITLSDNNSAPVPFVTKEAAMNYIGLRARGAKEIAIGVMLCIFSPIILLLLSGFTVLSTVNLREETAVFIGLFGLFVLVAIAVALFVTNSMRTAPYKFMETQDFEMDHSTTAHIRSLYNGFREKYIHMIVIGVVLCILSTLPLLGFVLLSSDPEFSVLLSICILLFIVGIGVFIIVRTALEKESYNVLLQEDDFARRSSGNTPKEISDIVGGFYWPVVTCIYLAISFLSQRWDVSWVIWPVAAVLFAGISSIIRLGGTKKQTSTK